MKLLLTLSFLSAISIIHGNLSLRRRNPLVIDRPSDKSTKEPEWNTINQLVDHFNPQDLRRWTMRYISNDQFFENGGPMIIYLGGEWEIRKRELTNGQIFDIAEENDGYMFYTEHRYYGKSYPVEYITVENLKYLTVEQALADVIYFIKYIKETVPGLEHSKVVVVGASYSACMAVWIRLKYPHVIDAAYASSGPVKAGADFSGYLDIAAKDIALVSPECLQILHEATFLLGEKLKSPEGRLEISQLFRTCKPIRNDKRHVSFVISEVIQALGGMTQIGGLEMIEETCAILSAYDGSPLEKLAAFVVRSVVGSDGCFPDYDDYLNNLPAGSWYYQTCTEFGFFVTTNVYNPVFSVELDIEFYAYLCSDVFGENFGHEVLLEGINRTNLFYGGSKPEVTKVVFVYGSVDPWHVLGVLSDLNPLAPSILINGTTHCVDLHPDMPTDPPQLTAARQKVKKLIREWIQ